MDLDEQLRAALAAVREWESGWGDFEPHPAQEVAPARMAAALGEYASRLRDNYPFFHPRYAGQMLKPPHPAAVTGYLAAMLINPNNHALDGGPATGRMEKEVVRDIADMFGFPDPALGHLTSSGTIANLEALWVARQIHPGKAIAFSDEAHYTHGRMCEVLGVETVRVPADDRGRMRMDALEDRLRSGDVGTVVLTAGTTGLGAVDPVADALILRERYGCRLHVDAAYGGFFALLAGSPELDADVARHFAAISGCDSVVVDPHKHGLQPYGCGCVLFRDPSVGQFYRHDSPYTYFTSDDLHLGEISLECSRAGASAGALWLTLQVLPLKAHEGLGPILAAGLRAARSWAALIDESDVFKTYVTPELDILTFFAAGASSSSAVDEASSHLFQEAMGDPSEPIFLSLLRVEAERLDRNAAGCRVDRSHARILRSVLMKPEHEFFVPRLHQKLAALAQRQINHG